MIEQQKILRVIRLISFLANGKRTISELIKFFDTSPSTIYKYLNLVSEVGYLVEKDFYGRYFIFEAMPKVQMYEEQEAELLAKCLSSLPNNNPHKASLLKKIKLNSNILPSPLELKQRMYGKIISMLDDAIKAKQWVRLCKYQSADSPEDIKDRIVFPLSINADNGQLNVFDNQKQELRIFKIHRITAVENVVENLDIPLMNDYTPLDIFGFTGPEPIQINLLISPRAKHLLEEEYPKSSSSILPTQHGVFRYQYRDEIRSFKGIGRFILGLPGEIVVQSPVELIDYLNMRIGQYSFRKIPASKS